jgi:hypothetical protein
MSIMISELFGRNGFLSMTLLRSKLMAKSRDTRKNAKKKPTKSLKEKKKAKQEKKKEK